MEIVAFTTFNEFKSKFSEKMRNVKVANKKKLL